MIIYKSEKKQIGTYGDRPLYKWTEYCSNGFTVPEVEEFDRNGWKRDVVDDKMWYDHHCRISGRRTPPMPTKDQVMRVTYAYGGASYEVIE